jgi:hypothetical protein
MNLSRLPEASRRRAEELSARSSLETVGDLAAGYLAAGDSLKEVIDHVRGKAAYNIRAVRRELAAVERVLAEPQSEGVLAYIVAWRGNWVLDDPSDTGAAAFLAQLADYMRAAVSEIEAARKSGGSRT